MAIIVTVPSIGSKPITVVVTGGTGLVGSGIREALADGYPKFVQDYHKDHPVVESEKAKDGESKGSQGDSDAPTTSKPNTSSTTTSTGKGGTESKSAVDTWVFVCSKDADLCEASAVKAMFARYSPTHVVHMAAFVGGLFRNMKYPVDFWHRNQDMNSNVYRAAHAAGVQRVISCLSTCIFPDEIASSGQSLREDQVHAGPPHDSNFAYAFAKRGLDIMNRAYNQQYGLKWTSIVPCNVYGLHDNFNIDESHVIPGMIHRFYRAQQSQSPVSIWGTGRALRQFVFARDLGKLIVWGTLFYGEVEPIIFAPDVKDEVSIKQVGEAVLAGLNYGTEISFDKTKADGQYRKTSSNDKLRKYLPKFTFTPLQNGIAETCQWFVKGMKDGTVRGVEKKD